LEKFLHIMLGYVADIPG